MYLFLSFKYLLKAITLGHWIIQNILFLRYKRCSLIPKKRMNNHPLFIGLAWGRP